MSNNYSLFDLLSADGVQLKRVASTNEGEWAGPCPKCGGRDRFRLWPEQGEGGRWWCRQCDHGGDAIEYLKHIRGMTFLEAQAFLGLEPSGWKPIGSIRPRLTTSGKGGRKWKPKGAVQPVEPWQEKAASLVGWAEENIRGPLGAKIRAWLRDERHLTDEAVKRARLGWIPRDYFPARQVWGLPEKLKENGRPAKMFVPTGLAIPLLAADGRVLRVRIRRSDPDADSRYHTLTGSSMEPMRVGVPERVIVIVESELDAILLCQVAGDLASFVAMGSATNKPDPTIHDSLVQAKKVLVALDADPAGAKAAWGWWVKTYPNAERWPVIGGKDPTDAMGNGLDIRAWVLAGTEEVEDAAEQSQSGAGADESLPCGGDDYELEEREAIVALSCEQQAEQQHDKESRNPETHVPCQDNTLKGETR